MTMDMKDISHDKNVSDEMTIETKDIFGINFWGQNIYFGVNFWRPSSSNICLDSLLSN